MSDQIQPLESQILDTIKAYYALEKPNIAKLACEFDIPYKRLRDRGYKRHYGDRSIPYIKKTINLIL